MRARKIPTRGSKVSGFCTSSRRSAPTDHPPLRVAVLVEHGPDPDQSLLAEQRPGVLDGLGCEACLLRDVGVDRVALDTDGLLLEQVGGSTRGPSWCWSRASPAVGEDRRDPSPTRPARRHGLLLVSPSSITPSIRNMMPLRVAVRLPATTLMSGPAPSSSSLAIITTARGTSTHAVAPRIEASAPLARFLPMWRIPTTSKSCSSARSFSGAIALRRLPLSWCFCRRCG